MDNIETHSMLTLALQPINTIRAKKCAMYLT